jgi:hypothetical protein
MIPTFPDGYPGAKGVTVRRGLLLVVLVAVIFFGSWWNGYAPPTSGGEAVLMAQWAHDYLPYRDYFSQAPPGAPMLVQAIAVIAGPHLLAVLTFGVLLRVVGACALYGLLNRVARPSFAAVGTLTALFVSSTDIGDTPFYYNHIGASLVLVGTYLGLASATDTRLRNRFAGVGAGAALTYALAVKQTMIFGVAASVVALVVLVLPRPRAGWVGWLVGLFVGAVVTGGGVWAWLAAHGLESAFLVVMRRASEGKGGVARSLLRPLSLLVDLPEALYASVSAWVVIAIVALLWVTHRREKSPGHAVGLVLAAAVALCVGRLASFADSRVPTLFLTALGWWGSLALAVLYWRSLGKGGLDPAARALFALGVLSFGIGYSFAVSWPLFENIAFPGLALVVAATLERPPTAWPRPWVGALLVMSCASMGVAVYRKATFPHSWGYWSEPPLYSQRGRFKHPALAGLRISEASSDLYAAPDDRIFVFPNMPILYAIANRHPATYSLAHWVDICPDFLGKDDAARLRANPPKLLIVREDPLSVIQIEEFLYRGGQPSSVRDIVAALNDIEPLYDKVAVFNATATRPIAFFVRRDSPS